MNARTMPGPIQILFLVAVQRRRSQGSLWLTWMLIAMLALLSLAPIYGDDAKLLILPAVPLLLLAILWCVAFAGACSEQYWHPTAGLVPGLRQRIRRLMIGATLALALVPGAAAGVVFGCPALWIAGLLFVLSAGVMYLSWGWLIGVLLYQAAIDHVGGPALGALVVMPAVQGLLLLASACIWWFRMRQSYPSSDAVIAAASEMRTRSGMQQAAAAMLERGLPAMFERWSRVRYAREVERDIRLRQRLAVHVIGAAGHWSTSMSSLVIPGVTIAMLVAFTDFRLEEKYLFFAQWLLIAAMWLLGLSTMQAMVRRIADTAGEQAILRFAPGVASGAALTREVVGTMWRRWLVWWHASTAGVLIALGAGFETLEQALQTVAFLSTSLVLSAHLLRDYTKAFKPLELGSASFLRLLLLTWVLLGTFLALRAYVAPVSWAVLILLNVAAAAGILWIRWRALERAPQLFPAARFA